MTDSGSVDDTSAAEASLPTPAPGVDSEKGGVEERPAAAPPPPAFTIQEGHLVNVENEGWFRVTNVGRFRNGGPTMDRSVNVNLAPVTVVDWRTTKAGEKASEEFIEWAKEHGAEERLCYRIEVTPALNEVRLFHYAADKNGKPFVHDAGKFEGEATHPQAGEVALAEPTITQLKREMPSPA